MKSKWNGKNNWLLLAALMLGGLLTACDADAPSKPGEGFYSYTGFRDYWRFPLQFPYHVIMIDTFQSGYIDKYNPAKNIAEFGSSTNLLSDVLTISPATDYVAFRREKDCGVLIYQNEKLIYFNTEQELIQYVQKTFPKEPVLNFQNMEECYKKTWDRIDREKKK